MSQQPFIHLRNHSAYSLLDGAIKVNELVDLAFKNNMPAVAMTDTSNMFGALEFSLEAIKKGIQPINGTLITLNFMPFLKEAQLLLLVQNEKGYQNLIHLISKAYTDSDDPDKPIIAFELLTNHHEGLICLTGGIQGPINQLIASQKENEAKELLTTLQNIFKDRLYVELSRHGLDQEKTTEASLIKLAYDHGIPLVATNDCTFKTHAEFEAHDALKCVATGNYVEQAERPRLNPEFAFKSSHQMIELFQDIPEAISNTVQIARRCHYLLKSIDPMLPTYPDLGDCTESEELARQSREGLEIRLKESIYHETDSPEDIKTKCQPYFDRLDYELKVIEQMKFPGYFLIVADFIKWAKNNEIPVGPGRGSGAGSVIAWALTITDLDPLKWGLLFERFLNPERVSMPDFDIDFCQTRRDEVIKYVQDRYGYDHVAQIITFGKLQARAVLRDVGRVLQLPYPVVDRICKMIPNNPANPVTLQEAIDGDKSFNELADSDSQIKKLIDIALKLEGLYRHASTHAAGLVIGDRPLHELVPIYRDPKSTMPVTQFSMKYVEQAGLVKFDFLGLKTLTLIKEALNIISHTENVEIDINQIPLDDKTTFELMSKGDTVGVFQLEGAGMRDTIKKMKPDQFEEIIALVSLYRPGPMENIPKYIAVKNGEEPADYLHPSLEPILKETFGIMIYQEQVMQTAQTLAGYTLGGADLLRRAMGKKIKSEMDKQREIFVDGSVKNNVDAKQAGKIFDQVAKFAGYGFNKSHAAAYALIAYQTGYLKANYMAEFLTASMTLDLGNTDKLILFQQELKKQKIPLLCPDVQYSDEIFKVELQEGKKCIRYALGAIKGVGEVAMKAVVDERKANGPFKSLIDFAKRLDNRVLNKRQMENLVFAGAFESLEPNRAKTFAQVEFLIRTSQTHHEELLSGQQTLFGESDDPAEKMMNQATSLPNWSSSKQLKHEFDAIGFFLTAHPLDEYKVFLQKQRIKTILDLRDESESQKCKVAGVITAYQERNTKKGNKMAFVQISDPTGLFEVTFFSEALTQAREFMSIGNTVLIDAECQIQDGEVRLLASNISSLKDSLHSKQRSFNITLDKEESIDHIKQILNQSPEGQSLFTFYLTLNQNLIAKLKWSTKLAITPEIMQQLNALENVSMKEC